MGVREVRFCIAVVRFCMAEAHGGRGFPPSPGRGRLQSNIVTEFSCLLGLTVPSQQKDFIYLKQLMFTFSLFSNCSILSSLHVVSSSNCFLNIFKFANWKQHYCRQDWARLENNYLLTKLQGKLINLTFSSFDKIVSFLA